MQDIVQMVQMVQMAVAADCDLSCTKMSDKLKRF
jgi:hypothetical protein